MGKCECGRLKGNPCGPLRPNTINVTMPSVDLIYLDPPFNSKTDYAAPLISKGIIRQDLRPGQAFEEGWVPFSVPDHIWAAYWRGIANHSLTHRPRAQRNHPRGKNRTGRAWYSLAPSPTRLEHPALVAMVGSAP